MKKHVIILLILSFSINIFSQRGNDPNYDTRIGSIAPQDNLLSKFYRLQQKEKETVQGTRFVFSDFKQKGLIYINNKAYTTYGVNIDAITNDIVSLVGVDSILVYNKNKIDSLRIGTKKFKKNNAHVFFEVLYSGSTLSFLKKHTGSITEEYKNVMKGTIEKENYKITEIYYAKEGNNYSILKLKKKEILKYFKENSNTVLEFAKKNKLSFKKETDLIQIFQYYNSL